MPRRIAAPLTLLLGLGSALAPTGAAALGPPPPARYPAAVAGLLPASGTPAAPAQLAGTRWLAEDIGGQGVIDALQSTLAFDADGGVTGNAGCNRYFGSATLAGDRLSFGPLGATRMACAPAVDEQERRFLEALDKTAGYGFEGGFLLLLDAKGRPLLRLSRME